METEHLELSQIKQKAIHGAISLTFRRIAINLIRSGIVAVLLPRYLDPAIIGTFNIANTIVSFFSFFSDVGLAAAIIQKKDLSEDDVSTTFVVQQILVIAVSIVLFILAPWLASYANLQEGGTILIRAFAISFFLISLKSIPSVLSERNLNFKPIVITDIAENAVFCALVLPLAIMGFGLYAYAIAQLMASLVGVILIYNLVSWKMSFKYRLPVLKEMLRFGLPFQANQLLALLKDRLVPLVVVRMITVTEMGYVTQGQTWAFIPLEAMNIVSRVTFPAYARLQHDREVLARAIERSIYLITFVVYPAIAGLVTLLPILISIVGANKWWPAVPIVYLFSLATFVSAISSTYTTVFNAVGQIKLTFRLMIMWTALEWLFTPILVWKFGYVGVGYASAMISITSVMTILLMRTIAKVRLVESVGKQFIASLVMATVLFPLAHFTLYSKIMLIPLVAIGGLVYISIMYFWDKQKLMREAKEIFRALR